MAFTITPQLIMSAAEKRGWTVRIISEPDTFYRLDTPDGQFFYLRNITSHKSSTLHSVIANQKPLLRELLVELNLPTPPSLSYQGDEAAAAQFLQTHRRVVVKPTDQSHGNGVTTNITTLSELKTALVYAANYGKTVLLQQHITGDDYRLLFIDGALAAAAIREPASVVGDGRSSLRQLIERANASPLRGDGYSKPQTKIDLPAAERHLGATLDDIPAVGHKVPVVGIANIGKGGLSIDVTHTVDPRLVAAGQKIINHFGIGLAGVDIICGPEGDFYILEINTGPSLGLHEYPAVGEPRQTPDKFLDWLVKA